MAGVDLVHVPYRGSTPALTDLLAGQVQVMFDVTPSSLPHIKAGKLRPLAVTTATRLDVLPEVPVMADYLPGYEASAWVGFGVPRNTPVAIIEALNKVFNAALADPDRQDASRRSRRAGDEAQYAGRIRLLHRRRCGEVGEGDQSVGNQARIGGRFARKAGPAAFADMIMR